MQGCLGEAGAEEVPKSSPGAGPLGQVHTSFRQVRGWEPQPPIARLEARPVWPGRLLGGSQCGRGPLVLRDFSTDMIGGKVESTGILKKSRFFSCVPTVHQG